MYQQQQRDPRGQYIPPPPPLTPAQSHGNTYLPPPPPRPMPSMNHGHGQSLPPPPPGGPQGVSYWNRQQYPPPPPLQGPVAPYNPGAYGAYSAVQTPVDPPDQPLTSATYYPSGESFGPGVGIPPLDPSGARPSLESFYSFEESTRPRKRSDVAARHRDREAREQADTAGYPSIHNSAAHNSAGALHYQPSALSRSPNHGVPRIPEQQSNPSLAEPSPKDPGSNWPMDTVLAWLSSNDFSDDWLRTFKQLDLHGSQFLDLGRGRGGRGNLNVLHTDIYPRLAKECTSSGSGWDQQREREEGKRLRRLIRQVVDDEGPPVINKNGRRSSFFNTHESQDGSTPSTADGNGGESPGFQPFSASTTGQTIAQRRKSTRAKTSTSTIPSPPAVEAPKSAHPEGSNSSQNHSPANSRDASNMPTAHRLELAKNSREQSPQLSPAIGEIRPSSGKSSGPPSAAAARAYGHRRAMSSSEFAGPAAPQNLHAPPDYKRNLTEADRLPVDSAKSNGSDNPPNSAKESRGGFFNKFRRDKGKDSHSPVSPVGTRSLFGNPKVNSSETSLDRPPSAATDTKKTTGGSWPMQRSGSQPQKRFIMVTPDGWNYRLIDVSEVDSLDTFHDLIRYNLNLSNSQDLQAFITAPGQKKHEDALSSSALSNTLRSAGPDGVLKLFIRGPQGNLMSATSAQSARFPTNPKISPFIGSADDLSSAKLEPDESERTLVPDSAKTTTSEAKGASLDADRASQLEAEHVRYRQEAERKQRAYLEERKAKIKKNSNDPTHNFGGPKSGGFFDFDEPKASPGEEKRSELVPKRAPPPAPPDPSNTMMKANSLSKRPQPQGSMRYSDSKRKSGESYDGSLRTRRKAPTEVPTPAGGIGNAIAGAGQMMAAPVRSANGSAENGPTGDAKDAELKRSMSSAYAGAGSGQGQGKKGNPGGSPNSPGFTMSKGNIPFKIPEYSESSSGTTPGLQARPSMHARLPSNPNIEKLRGQRPGSSGSIEASPTTPPQSGSLSRRSTRGSRHGPTLDFTEHHVSFNSRADATPQVSDDSDDDSDDDLFAVPLRGHAKTKEPIVTAEEERPDSRSSRPSLTIKTPSTNRIPSVSLDTSKTTAQDVSQPVSPTDGTKPANKDSKDAPHSARPPRTPDSPEFRKGGHDEHRNSVFEIEEGWANRPQAELLIEDLDKFFPQVDLDQPIVDEKESPPESPTIHRHTKTQKSIDNMRGNAPASTQDSEQEDTDTIHTLKSVAQRNVRKSQPSGLGRTKSIREVVKSNYQQPSGAGLQRNPTVNRSSILRRKSTKVFGSIATEVKPRNSKLGMLEPIPQDSIAVIPKRQDTFKWMKGQLIGKGTFGRVYLGMNIGTGELLAVKQVEVNPNKAGQDKEKVREMVRALDQEIDTMQHLDHENIVQYLGCERKEYSISIFLEYISGGSVGSCLRKHGKFEETVVSSLTRQVLNGLAYLHREGILHRDLKADNILLDMDGVCKISDFGISKKTDNIYGNDATNSMQGSVFWMAPEVVRSQGEGYSAKVDIWSLGCVVLEMFQGKRPFAGDELVGAIFKLGSLNQPPPIPDEVSKAVSPAALSFMFDCWNIDPADRPTADTLLRAPFAFQNGDYNWYDTTLYEKIKVPTAGAETRVKQGAN
ncbi:hypothetical protein FH972_025515 [Carpinus fangiana]|uniref:mitogen-activated protein kinase kinase kinase n=1 Tax=Carpinus fangiana TaxID=176857 RepID=A0A5N6L1V2_9ROSI|nr:hypothetical protein FH972_025515 [Carpinus fangiana]